MNILGIETSCDETAASVVKDGRYILSNVVSSSLKLHKRYGGVVPEIATRFHTEVIDVVIKKALKEANLGFKKLDAISVTKGPGLVGALLVGISCAKAISFSLKLPLVPVDHLKAHIYSAIMNEKIIKFPLIALIISGGHTRLVLNHDFDRIEVLGQTQDDAVGEAFDKVAKILDLGYPGGPIIDRFARKGNPNKIRFPRTKFSDSLDFSFSGIKTAVLYYVRDLSPEPRAQSLKIREQVCDIVASFQEAIVDMILDNTFRALEKNRIKILAVGGGVSANSRLRERLTDESCYRGIRVYFPEAKLCMDNAAMVAGLGYQLFRMGQICGLDVSAEPNL